VRRACLIKERHAKVQGIMWLSSKHCEFFWYRRYHDHDRLKEHLARIPNRALRSQQTLQKVIFTSNHCKSDTSSGGRSGGGHEQSHAYGGQQ
jgi:hypothetical protein